MPLVSSSLTASARNDLRAHRPTGRRQLRTLEIRVRFSVSPLKETVPWSNGTTSGPHPENDGSTPSGTISPRYANWQSGTA
jgi:hypothetical protein